MVFLAQSVGIPTLKYFDFSETIILIVLSAISTLSRVFITFANEPWMFYAGNLFNFIRYNSNKLNVRYGVVDKVSTISYFLN